MADVIYCKSGGSDNNSGSSFSNSAAYSGTKASAGKNTGEVDISADVSSLDISAINTRYGNGNLYTMRVAGSTNGLNNSDVWKVIGVDTGSEIITVTNTYNGSAVSPNSITGDWALDGSFSTIQRSLNVEQPSWTLRWCYSSSPTISSTLNAIHNGDTDVPIYHEAGDSSTGNATTSVLTLSSSSATPVFSDNNASNVEKLNREFRYLGFTSTATSGHGLELSASKTESWDFIECEFSDCSHTGCETSVNSNHTFTRCKANGNTYHGFYVGHARMVQCKAMNNGSYGIRVYANDPGAAIVNCTLANNDEGVYIYTVDVGDVSSTVATIVCNTFHDNDVAGIYSNVSGTQCHTQGIFIARNIFSSNPLAIKSVDANFNPHLIDNHFYNNTSIYGPDVTSTDESPSTGDPKYVSVGSSPYDDDDDFRLYPTSAAIDSDGNYKGAMPPFRRAVISS